MLGKRQIPVYLFSGFLESGKTSFIRETLSEGQFEDGKQTLLIMCEEGEEELDSGLLTKNKVIVKSIENEEEITESLFLEYDKSIRPHRVMIEANGTWDLNTIIEAFPDQWVMAEGVATIDASTFEMYLSNMKQMMMSQVTYADLVLFNRCLEQYDRAMFKRMVRAVNKRAQILFETPEGVVDDKVEEELPYDLNTEVIEVGEDDFGIWYLDAMEHLDVYKGKTVKFKGIVYHPRKGKEDVFVPGRFAMTCCADDVAFIGFPCKYEDAKFLSMKQWVTVTAKIGGAMSREYGKMAPVLYATNVESAEPAKEELVYFN
ncbi:MAG: GTP-binding protein [Lachnospiraceae bacterium]|nr:GTP-binding protein [Lachnospiraceae bacterium]